MNVVALVPIKLNSSRIPHKNLLELEPGKALCSYVPKTLSAISGLRTYVFCSDPSVKAYLPESVTFLQRNPRLDGDTVKGEEIYAEFIRQIPADVYLLAHTTSPFLRRESIENALCKVLSGSYDSAFSVRKIQTFAWYNGGPLNYELTDVPRTQDITPVYIETSGFYIFKNEIFTRLHRRIGDSPYMQILGEIESLDIDEPGDFDLAVKIAASL